MFGTLPAYGFYIRHATNISFDGIQVSTKKTDLRPAFYLEDVKWGRFDEMQVQSCNEPEADFLVKDSQNILINANILNSQKACTVKTEGDKNSNIQLNSIKIK
jgi:hypothetical protein